MRLALAMLPLWLLACSSPLSEAQSAFDEGRYPEAVAEYRALASQVGGFEQKELFEYALYRGLAQLALGDAQPARRWLGLAKRLADACPALANDDQRGSLMAAWRSMGFMPGQ